MRSTVLGCLQQIHSSRAQPNGLVELVGNHCQSFSSRIRSLRYALPSIIQRLSPIPVLGKWAGENASPTPRSLARAWTAKRRRHTPQLIDKNPCARGAGESRVGFRQGCTTSLDSLRSSMLSPRTISQAGPAIGGGQGNVRPKISPIRSSPGKHPEKVLTEAEAALMKPTQHRWQTRGARIRSATALRCDWPRSTPTRSIHGQLEGLDSPTGICPPEASGHISPLEQLQVIPTPEIMSGIYGVAG